MKLTGPECKYFYLCDRQKGACPSWKKYRWKICQNLFCQHTTNPEHARNKAGRKFKLIIKEDGTAERWEIEKQERLEFRHE